MISQPATLETVMLTARSDTGATRSYQLRPDQGVFAGSSSNCGLQLPGSEIADIHCRIGLEDGKLFAQAWLSADGILLNGQPMTEMSEISMGDVIKIGRHEITVESPGGINAQLLKPAADQQVEAPTDSCEQGPPEIDDPPVDVVDQLDVSVDPPTCVDAPLCDDPEASCDDPEASCDDPEASCDDPEASYDDPEARCEDPEAAGDDSALLSEDPFCFDDEDEEEVYDRETVALLRAEIEELQAALAQRDAELHIQNVDVSADPLVDPATESDEVLQRMQELVDEANRSDERVAILEEMLHSSEIANRREQEERQQLEAWVHDIEQRIAQRETEHAAEIEALRRRVNQSQEQKDRLQKKIQQAAFSVSAPKHYEETLESLQQANRELQDKLADSEKQRLVAEQKLEQSGGEQDHALRAERAEIAQERAKVARLRHELSKQLSDIEALPKADHQADREAAHRLQTLREHLREIHEQEKQEEKEAPLTKRLAKLWKRVEY